MTTLKQALVVLEQQATTDFRRRALQHIIPPLIQGLRVLDAGCGMGFMTKILSTKPFYVVATDIDCEFVASAVCDTHTQEHIADGIVSADGCLPIADASCDTILSLDVIEHIEDDAYVLREFARVLRPNGRLILTVPALPALYGRRDKDLGHYRRYTKTLLHERLVNAGFEIAQTNYWNILGVLPYFLAEHVLQRPIPDTIRQGQPTIGRQILAALITWWLLGEWKVARYLPFGLSLVVVAYPKHK